MKINLSGQFALRTWGGKLQAPLPGGGFFVDFYWDTAKMTLALNSGSTS